MADEISIGGNFVTLEQRETMLKQSLEALRVDFVIPKGFQISNAERQALGQIRIAVQRNVPVGFLVQKIKGLDDQRAFRFAIESLFVNRIKDKILENLIENRASTAFPTYSQLSDAISSTLANFDAGLVRFALAVLVDYPLTTARRVIVQVLCNHPALRLAAFPKVSPDISDRDEVRSLMDDALDAVTRAKIRIESGKLPELHELRVLDNLRDKFQILAERSKVVVNDETTFEELLEALSEAKPEQVERLVIDQIEDLRNYVSLLKNQTPETVRLIRSCDDYISRGVIDAPPDELVKELESFRKIVERQSSIDERMKLSSSLRWMKTEFPGLILMYVEGLLEVDFEVIDNHEPGSDLDGGGDSVESVGESLMKQMVEPRIDSDGTAQLSDETSKSGNDFREVGESDAGKSRESLQVSTSSNEQPVRSDAVAIDDEIFVEEDILRLISQGRVGLARAIAAQDERFQDWTNLLSIIVLQADSRWTNEVNPLIEESARLFGLLDRQRVSRHPFLGVLCEIAAINGAIQTGRSEYSNALHQFANSQKVQKISEFMRIAAVVPFGGCEVIDANRELGSLPTVRDRLVREASEFLSRAPSRNIKYAPSRTVWSDLIRSDRRNAGLIGFAVSTIAQNDSSRLSVVRDAISEMEDIEEFIDRSTRENEHIHSGITIHSGAREQLRRNLMEPLNIMRQWTELHEEDSRSSGKADPADARVLSEGLELVLRSMIESVDERFCGALESIVEVSAIRKGKRVGHRIDGLTHADVLSFEVESTLEIPTADDGFASTELHNLLEGSKSTQIEPTVALTHFGRLGDFARVERISRVLRLRGMVLPEDVDREVEAASRRLLLERDETVREVTSLLMQVRRLNDELAVRGAIGDSDFSRILQDVELAQNPDWTSSELRSFMPNLRHHRDALQESLNVVRDVLRGRVLAQEELGRIDSIRRQVLIDALSGDNLRPVVDRIVRIEEGLGDLVVRADQFGFDEFYRNNIGVAERIAQTPATVKQIVSGEVIQNLKFPVQDDPREVERVLNSWIGMRGLAAGERIFERVRDLLEPILRMIGIEKFTSLSRSSDDVAGAGRLWVDVKGVEISGRAMVPTFGSLMPEQTLRILVQFEKANPHRIDELARMDRSGLQILVVYLGEPLSQDARKTLATLARKHDFLAPILDWAILVEMVRQPSDSRFERFIHLAMPFTWRNPFVPYVQGRVPRELFYGRSTEVRRVIDATGPTFVYGGRQLGKSALLRRSASEIEEREANGVGIYIDLKHHLIGEGRPPQKIWDLVGEELQRRHASGFQLNPKQGGFERVREAITNWLDGDGTRRILILLDECDKMLAEDSLNHFEVSNQIRGLIEVTNRRCKVVLAGLNSVHRYFKGFNHPMAHLAGEAIEVGPLRTSDATKLVTEPLNLLGFRFAHEFGVDQILAATNDQASLIQLVCHRLTEKLRSTSMRRDLSNNIIEESVITSVLADPDTESDLTRRFEWTIDLDSRYSAIAYRMVLEFFEGKRQVTSVELYETCRLDFSSGFKDCGLEEFRWFLDELRTFGILQKGPDDQWLLRSPNVARMFGTYEEVEERLYDLSRVGARSRDDFDFMSSRARVGGLSLPSPLALDQHDRISSEFEGVRFIVCSKLMGGDMIRDSVEATAHESSMSVDWLEDSDRFIRMVEGDSSDSPNILVCDIRKINDASVEAFIVQCEKIKKRRRALVIALPFQVTSLDPIDERLIHVRTWDEKAMGGWFNSENIEFADEDIGLILDYTAGLHTLLVETIATKPRTVEEFIETAKAFRFDAFEDPFGLGLGPQAHEIVRNICEAVGAGASLQDLLQVLPDLIERTEPLHKTVNVIRHSGLLVGGVDRVSANQRALKFLRS